MTRQPIESMAELRTALAEAIPPQHRAQAVSLGRLLLSALGDQSPQSGDPAAAMPPAVGAQPEPEPSPPTPLDRVVHALKGELDQRGLAMPQDRYRSRIPLVMRPRRSFEGR